MNISRNAALPLRNADLRSAVSQTSGLPGSLPSLGSGSKIVSSVGTAAPNFEPSEPSVPSVTSCSSRPGGTVSLRVLPSALSFCVPLTDSDQSAFNSLPQKVRDDIDTTLLALENLHGAKKLNPACKLLAPSLSLHRPLSWHALRRKYYAFIKSSGDWRALVDWTRVKRSARPGADAGPTDAEALCPDFINYLKGLMDSNQRKSEPAIRALYRNWRAGLSIPGYGTWQQYFQDQHPHEPLPRACMPDLPRGWSKTNLRRYIPDGAELALARRGLAEARRHLPDILITRAGLRPLEYVMFDDVRTDFKILVPGYASPVELNCLVALDVATGVILRYGMRPAIQRADGMSDKLKLRDMKALVAGILQQYGLPRHWTMTLIVENATAAIRADFEAALKEASLSNPSSSDLNTENCTLNTSPSGIQVHRTEMICGSALWAGYKDRATGNPGGKAALESTFNLFHNEAAFLPGQTGRRYDAGPAELHGRTAEAVALHRAGKHLQPHERAALKLPFLNYTQARVVITDLWNRLCQRTDHAMEAFDLVGEFRLREFDQWRPESDLLTDPSLASIDHTTIFWRNPARRESPVERWSRLCELEIKNQKSEIKNPLFRHLHPSVIARLLEEHRLRPVTNYEITFDFDKETHVYRLANLIGIENRKSKIENGNEVLCYFDPHDLEWIHLTDAHGGYLGSIKKTRGLDRRDHAALQAAYKAKRQQLHDLQKTVSSRLPERLDQAIDDTDHNANILSEALANSEARNADLSRNADLRSAVSQTSGLPGSLPSLGSGSKIVSSQDHDSEPAYSREISQSAFAACVAQRQAAARQLAPAPAGADCTDDLLARESATTSEPQPDDWQQ